MAFLVLLKLDHDHLKREILVPLQESYFRKPLLEDFEWAIAADPGGKVICQSDPLLDSGFFSSADVSIPLEGRPFPFPTPARAELGISFTFDHPGKLNLITRHRLGSLAAAIGRRRNQDLLQSLGILLLLAAATVTLLVSVQRTRRLAKRQMDFVAGVSHELRNPLTAIQSAGFNLSRGSVREEERIRKYGEIISRESRRLTRMVEQVLSYAGIQESRNQYNLQILRLEEVLEKVLQEYASVFEEQKWDIETQVEEELPSVSADPKALESCLRNLIDNALKYAAEVKSLEVQMISKEESRRRWVEISVQDKGRGIPSSELPHIFEPFYRGADRVASSNPGSGLGLAIVKRHVEAHGGKIRVYSKLAEGSKFLLSLPAVPPTQSSNEAREDKNGS